MDLSAPPPFEYWGPSKEGRALVSLDDASPSLLLFSAVSIGPLLSPDMEPQACVAALAAAGGFPFDADDRDDDDTFLPSFGVGRKVFSIPPFFSGLVLRVDFLKGGIGEG